MNKQLLEQITINLYEIESILKTNTTQKLLEAKNIDTHSLFSSVKLYLKYFDELATFEDETLLKMLNEKLKYFVENSENPTNISLYHAKLATSITFIETKMELFLNLSKSHYRKSITKNYPSEDINYLKNIKVKNFYSIEELQLNNLYDKKEIYIVGENGDGKTLLLQAIAVALKGCEQDGQGIFRKIKDSFELNITDENGLVYNSKSSEYKNLYAYGSSRNNNCTNNDKTLGYLTLFDSSLDLIDPKKWLIKLYNAEQSNETDILSVDEAKRLLQKLLNRDIEINITYNSVVFIEKGAEVNFEQLSAGYKSVITIVCDLIEMLSQNQSVALGIDKFKGVVLIDEVELHLHPKWKYDFMHILREIFPLIQFIVTTHSPTVILGASKEAVFYKIFKVDGKVTISQPIINRGYTNNTLISSPLFDLGTMASRDYDNSKFSSDDYIFEKMHERISKKVSENMIMDDDEIAKLIDKELEKL